MHMSARRNFTRKRQDSLDWQWLIFRRIVIGQLEDDLNDRLLRHKAHIALRNKQTHEQAIEQPANDTVGFIFTTCNEFQLTAHIFLFTECCCNGCYDHLFSLTSQGGFKVIELPPLAKIIRLAFAMLGVKFCGTVCVWFTKHACAFDNFMKG